MKDGAGICLKSNILWGWQRQCRAGNRHKLRNYEPYDESLKMMIALLRWCTVSIIHCSTLTRTPSLVATSNPIQNIDPLEHVLINIVTLACDPHSLFSGNICKGLGTPMKSHGLNLQAPRCFLANPCLITCLNAFGTSGK